MRQKFGNDTKQKYTKKNYNVQNYIWFANI